MKVTDANLENGLLAVALKREVPEALKPRRIEIKSDTGVKSLGQDNKSTQIEHGKAA